MHPAFQFNQYRLRRQAIALTGTFRLYNPSGDVVAYSRQKMFKLREDIRLWDDERQSQELLHIQARSIIDFSAAYDVIDRTNGQRVGTLRRQGLQSLARDTWQVLDANERKIGTLLEDNLTQALLRRFILGQLLPQNYDLIAERGGRLADLRQRFNPFRYEMDLDFSEDTGMQLDRRLGIAAAILLAAIEGRQE